MSRRRTLRIRCDLPAWWSTAGASGWSRVLDVSADGLLLAGFADLTPGARIDVIVHLPEESIALTAEVRFVGDTRHGHGFGLAITATQPDRNGSWNAYYRNLADHTIARAPATVRRYLRGRTGG